MTPRIGFGAAELAMRSLELVRVLRAPHKHLCDYALAIQERYGTSRATAYRLARKATDVLCIHVPTHPHICAAQTALEAMRDAQ